MVGIKLSKLRDKVLESFSFYAVGGGFHSLEWKSSGEGERERERWRKMGWNKDDDRIKISILALKFRSANSSGEHSSLVSHY